MTSDSRLQPRDPATGSVSLCQLASLSGIAEADLLDLIDYGVLMPDAVQGHPELFSVRSVRALQRAQTLRADLALDAHAFALAVMLSGQIVDLEAELRIAKADLRSLRVDSELSDRVLSKTTHNVH